MRRIVIVVSVSFLWPLVAVTSPRQDLAGVDLQLVEIADSGSYFVYRYELTNPSASTWGLSSVDVRIPASSGTPPTLATTGEIFDLTASGGAVDPHAEVGPIAPAGWIVILSRDATVTWALPSGIRKSFDSLAPGQMHDSLGLRSSYLPGITEVRAEPTVQSCCAEPYDTTPNDELYYTPGSFRVFGAAVAPRYMPSEVDLDLVQSQRSAVCTNPLWLNDAPLCTELADSLDAADARLASGDNTGARTALQGVLTILDGEREPTGPIEDNAYWLLRLNTEHVLGSIPGAGDVATGSATGGVTANGTVTSVVTSTQLNGGTDQLYLAQVDIRSTRAVSSVSGGGLTWTLVGAKDGDRGITRVEVWKAFGSPGSAFNVTANMATAASTVTLTAVRYSGASADIEDVQTAGTCDTNPNSCTPPDTAADNASVAVMTTSAAAGAVHFVALNPRNRIISSADPDYAMLAQVGAGSGGEEINSCALDHSVSSPGADTFAVTLNNPADWAVVAFVINGAGEGGGEGGQFVVLGEEPCMDEPIG